MTCTHLRELYQLVGKYEIKLGSSDLIRIICPHCGVQDTCPARLMDEMPEDESASEKSKTTEKED